MINEGIKRILIMRPEHIGDYALSFRAVASIRKKYPSAKMDIIVGPWNKDLAEATLGINKVIIFNHPFVKRHIGYKGILKALTLDFVKMKRFISTLNKSDYDLYINFSDRKYNLIFDRLIKAKRKILGTRKKYLGGRDVERIEDLLRSENINIIRGKLSLNLQKNKKQKTRKLIVGKGMKKILVHPITSLKEKDWPLEKWEKLLRLLLRNKKLEISMLGTSKEKKALESIRESIKSQRLKNLAGEITLPQLVNLISESSLIFGGDSGPVHLAEITGTPMFILFGPTDEIRWGPKEGQGDIIKNSEIKKINVKEVLEKIKNLI
jgi:ADP-heptose:LPS heptosyltransferase